MGFITGGPNEAIVVSGCCHGQPLIVVGGWVFVIPCVQKVQVSIRWIIGNVPQKQGLFFGLYKLPTQPIFA